MVLGAGSRVVLATLALATLLCALALAGTGPDRAVAGGCRYAQAELKNLAQKQFRVSIRCLVNRKRGARNLRGNPDLSKAALRHSRYMRNHECFLHQCPGEPPLYKRVKRTGYLDGARRWELGEVIAKSLPRHTPRDVLRQLRHSPAHEEQLMSSRFRHMGAGFAIGSRRAYSTVVLGDRSY